MDTFYFMPEGLYSPTQELNQIKSTLIRVNYSANEYNPSDME